jgi:hypothetical protein
MWKSACKSFLKCRRVPVRVLWSRACLSAYLEGGGGACKRVPARQGSLNFPLIPNFGSAPPPGPLPPPLNIAGLECVFFTFSCIFIREQRGWKRGSQEIIRFYRHRTEVFYITSTHGASTLLRSKVQRYTALVRVSFSSFLYNCVIQKDVISAQFCTFWYFCLLYYWLQYIHWTLFVYFSP